MSKSQQLSIRLPTDLYLTLSTCAAEEGTSINQKMISFLRTGLGKQQDLLELLGMLLRVHQEPSQ